MQLLAEARVPEPINQAEIALKCTHVQYVAVFPSCQVTGVVA